MNQAIIVDIDGTAALGIGDHRKAYDYHLCGNDWVYIPVFRIIDMYNKCYPNGKVIFLSGRENVSFPGKSERKDKCFRVGKFKGQEYPDCYTLTEAWIIHYLGTIGATIQDNSDYLTPVGDFSLHMRAADDYRKDDEVKFELYKEHVDDKYFIHYVLDDRNQVVDMWRDKCNLTCFQVAPGDF